MPKLKLTRAELQVLTACTQPNLIEERIVERIYMRGFMDLHFLFVMLDLGEKVTKKFYFTNKEKYNLMLSFTECSALYVYTNELLTANWDAFSLNTLRRITSALHLEIINYRKRLN